MHVMLSIAGSWAESSSRNNVNIFPWGPDHLEVYQFDDHNLPGGKIIGLMAPYGCGTLAHPKVCPCLSKQMRTGRRDHMAMRAVCAPAPARARTANRSSGAPCYRNQPRPNVPDNPIILVAAKAKVSLGSKLPAGSCSADHFALLTELATVTLQYRATQKGGSQVASALFPLFFATHPQ